MSEQEDYYNERLSKLQNLFDDGLIDQDKYLSALNLICDKLGLSAIQKYNLNLKLNIKKEATCQQNYRLT